MSRIYGETIETKIRNAILIAAFAICFFGCSKEDESVRCKTCTVTVTQYYMGTTVTNQYVESSTQYCNNEADTIQQGTIYSKMWNTQIGNGYYLNEIRKTRECH